MPQRRISWRERRTATPAERDDEHEPPIRHAKSAGCSPLVHRKLKYMSKVNKPSGSGKDNIPGWKSDSKAIVQ
ncbi:unnamed protein product [Nippostrongylus brasiliensis]|uniref:Uncharacterized protein n=1 Tax=Nippostrongylus brasiliensis TaxID=27835 RepID=A0A0N4XLF4_NIPBR|nr:unnamed protein product [Nippostrongylus brasiliensis]